MIPLRDANPSRKRPVVTIFLIIINVLIFIFETSLPYNLLEEFLKIFGFIPLMLTKSLFGFLRGNIQLYILPVFTSMFLHGSWTHLISNMWALWLFGDNVEDRMGHFKFLMFYLISGAIAALVHYLFNFNSPVVTIGASGAIAGVMGAYFVMFPFARITTLIPLLWIPFFVDIPSFIYIGLWFISQISNGVLTLIGPLYGAGIAWWAHIGGFLYGAYVAPKFKRKRYYGYMNNYYGFFS